MLPEKTWIMEQICKDFGFDYDNMVIKIWDRCMIDINISQ